MNAVVFIVLGFSVILVGVKIGSKIGEWLSKVLINPILVFVKWFGFLFLWLVVSREIGKTALDDLFDGGGISIKDFISEATPTFMLCIGVTAIGLGLILAKNLRKEEIKPSVKENDSNNGNKE